MNKMHSFLKKLHLLFYILLLLQTAAIGYLGYELSRSNTKIKMLSEEADFRSEMIYNEIDNQNAWVLLWLLVLVFISAAITADNPQIIGLHLFGKAYEASAGLIFMVSLGVGALLGIVLLLPKLWLLQRKVRKLVKLLQQANDPPAP